MPQDGVQLTLTPGHGPSQAQMDAASYTLKAWGEAADGRVARATIAGAGDPGNRITVCCACESAFALAVERDTLPDRFGVLTPAVAMGDVLARRLSAAGLRMQVS